MSVDKLYRSNLLCPKFQNEIKNKKLKGITNWRSFIANFKGSVLFCEIELKRLPEPFNFWGDSGSHEAPQVISCGKDICWPRLI